MDWHKSDSPQTTQLEVVTIYRPTRVIATLCCFIGFILLFISIIPTDWAETESSTDIRLKEGLFRICERDTRNCFPQNKAFIKGCAALMVLSFLISLATGVMLVYAILSRKEEVKSLIYRVALCLSIITAVFIFISLIVFPSSLHVHLTNMDYVSDWFVGWAYMLGWPALLVMIIAAVLLFMERNPDETSIREKVSSNSP